MLARTTYPKAYVATARRQFEADIAEIADPGACRNAVLALDHYFVHRARGAEPKKDSACKAVRALAEALMEDGATPPSPDELRALADAYFAEISEAFAE
jgi:hypothetical protein